MKREAPSDREIADLIALAYEGLPAPEARRLAAIEERLLERPRRRVGTAWWWLFAALAAGAASALWWAVDYDSGEGPEAPVPAITAPPVTPQAQQPARPERAEGTGSAPAGQPARKPGPVIYQRER